MEARETEFGSEEKRDKRRGIGRLEARKREIGREEKGVWRRGKRSL